ASPSRTRGLRPTPICIRSARFRAGSGRRPRPDPARGRVEIAERAGSAVLRRRRKDRGELRGGERGPLILVVGATGAGGRHLVAGPGECGAEVRAAHLPSNLTSSVAS